MQDSLTGPSTRPSGDNWIKYDCLIHSWVPRSAEKSPQNSVNFAAFRLPTRESPGFNLSCLGLKSVGLQFMFLLYRLLSN
ncbi:unnamed protein product [Schistocephalus solidus]|uniref:Uncharacterized protein n=1 Tax=Schistocephalus solidus TaxID=70667 RepID=A0A183SNZ0_SCHSO|nr:unnamed protein product [Schistocephalus solidus]